MMSYLFLSFTIAAALVALVHGKAGPNKGYKPFPSEVAEHIIHPRPHSYLKASELPEAYDIRNVNGTNYGTRALTQQNPNVCGSCWAEALTGALSDRFALASEGRLRVQLSPQVLLNFKEEITGGSCVGGDSLKGYEFIYNYGIGDDTCQPFIGLNWAHGFTVADMTSVADVRDHQCYKTNWDGTGAFIPADQVPLYSIEEYGKVKGEEEMMAEIYARGSISCAVNSEARAFDEYKGGIIKCPKLSGEPLCDLPYVDHVIVIAGWGIDKTTGTKYWVGRNSYGSQWGEGSEGGWFRLERGTNALNMETRYCVYGVPKKSDIDAANQRFFNSVSL